ncbi:MAG: DUF4358 domain-containing protein [Lachnospiraceae bacterium]|nr:DUF4358 domain-containing protein [Lachnospiraceae bacterium]
MKKNTVLVCGLAAASMMLCLAGCGEQNLPAGGNTTPAAAAATEAPAPTEEAAGPALLPTEIYETIKTTYELPEMYEADADWLMNNYGIDESMLSDYIFAEGNEVHADRVIILKVADEANVPAIEEKLNNVLGQLSSPEMLSYLPEQADMIKAASVKKQGDVLYLVISPDAAGIETIIQNGLAGK